MWSVLQRAGAIVKHSACFFNCHTGNGMLVALHAFLCDLRYYLSSDDVCHDEECVVPGFCLYPIADTHVRVIGGWLPGRL